MRRGLTRGALTAALTLTSTSLAAQDTAPLVLRLAPSARVLGLGDAFVAGRGPDAVFSNPALVGLRHGTFAAAGRFRGASTLAAFATSTSLGPVAVALGGQWLDYAATTGTFPTPPGALVERGDVPARSVAGSVAAALAVKDIRVGLAVKYLDELVSPARAGVAAIDVGVSRDLARGRLTLGLAAQNLGRDLDLGWARADLPSRVTLGAAIRPMQVGAHFDLFATAAVAREEGGRIAPAGGAELSYVPLEGFVFALRAGARRPEPAADGRGRRAWTLGATAAMDRVALDYALEPMRGAGAGHRIGLRIH